MELTEDITGLFTAAFVVYLYFQLLSNVTTQIDLETGEVRTRVDAAQIVASTLETSVIAGRAFGEVGYDAVAYDPGTGAVIVEGVSFSRRDATTGQPIRATLDALAVSTSDGGDDLIDMRIDVVGLEAPLGALDLPPPVEFQLAAIGLDALRADATVSVNYDLSSSDGEIAVEWDVEGVGAMSAAVELSRLHLMGVENSDPRLEGELRAVSLSFEDLGALDAGLALLGLPSGAEGADDVAALVRTQALALLAVDPSTGRETAPTPEARDFADALSAAAERFIADGGAIGIGARPIDPPSLTELQRLIDRAAFDLRARIEIVQALSPTAGSAPPAIRAIIAEAPSAEAPIDARLAAARAYIEGVGAPRNLVAALDILDGVQPPTAEALALLAEALEAEEGGPTVASYAAALRAEAAGAPGASGRVLRHRTALDLDEMLSGEAIATDGMDLTDEVAALLDRAEAGDPLAMRALAGAYGLGDGAPRNVLESYRWAALGAAAGDRPSQRRRDAIAALYAQSEDAELWRSELRAIDAEAADLWADGLGAAVAANQRR